MKKTIISLSILVLLIAVPVYALTPQERNMIINMIKDIAWYDGNDGAGSGLDADLVDGLDSAQFLRNDQDGELTGGLTIDGNVGIGTTGPGEKLEIADGNLLINNGENATIQSSAHNLIFAGNGYAHRTYTFKPGGSIAGATYATIALQSADAAPTYTTKVYLHSDGNSYFNGGNVGIGTTAPSYKLHTLGGNVQFEKNGGQSIGLEMRSSAGGTPYIDFSNDSSDYDARMVLVNDDQLSVQGARVCDINGCIGDGGGLGDNLGDHTATQNIELSDKWLSNDGGNEGIRISDDGKVGIGDSSPVSKLTVSGKITGSQSGNYWGAYITSATNQDDEGAIYGKATNTGSHNTVGVFGVTDASGNANGQPIGVRGDAIDDSPTGGQYGVLGYSYATAANGAASAGVFGGSMGGDPSNPSEFDGTGVGVQGETFSTATHSAGGRFYYNASNGTGKAVYAINNSQNANSTAVYYSGGLTGSGDKNAVVYTEEKGPVKVYSMESPEVWFEDIGMGELINGYSKINIDHLFLDTVTIDEQNPMHVFIQLYDNTEANDVIVKKGTDSFEVIEKNNGKSSTLFSYRIIAKREFYENKRLTPFKASVDKYMRPDLSNEELRELNDQLGTEYIGADAHKSPSVGLPPEQDEFEITE